jgi:hypothetical protein
MRTYRTLIAPGVAMLALLTVAACEDGRDGYRSGGRTTYIDKSGTVNRNDNCYDRHGDWNYRCDRDDDDDDDDRRGDRARDWIDRIFR